jgi:DeoR/GlpR family transcriptional regulator of sugar metabolism
VVDTVAVLASQRQDRILAEVRAHGAVRVADLVEQLDVSEMTVRRDITELDRAGLVRRVHGGAVAADGGPGRPTDEPAFAEKSTWATDEKRDIAALAARPSMCD